MVNSRFLILLLLIIRTTASTENGSLAVEENIFEGLHWNNKKFLENGCPPITSELDKTLDTPNFTFEGNYSVIVDNLETKGHRFIVMENINVETFLFYGEKFPEADHYNFTIKSERIERCDENGDLHCVPLEECHNASVPHENNVDLSKTAIFITWQKNEKHLTLLFQYEEKIVKCVDYNSLPFKKLVLKRPDNQPEEKGSVITRNYKWTNQSDVSPRTEIKLTNESISAYVSYCFDCIFELTLESCPSAKNTTKHKLQNVTFSNNVVVVGWQQVIIDVPPGANSTCQLIISTKCLNKYDKFWIIGSIEVIPKKQINVTEEKPDNVDSVYNCTTAKSVTKEEPDNVISVSNSNAKNVTENDVNSKKQVNNTKEKQDKVICVCNNTEKNVTTNVNLFNNYTYPAVEAPANQKSLILILSIVNLVCVIGLCVIGGYCVLKTIKLNKETRLEIRRDRGEGNGEGGEQLELL